MAFSHCLYSVYSQFLTHLSPRSSSSTMFFSLCYNHNKQEPQETPLPISHQDSVLSRFKSNNTEQRFSTLSSTFSLRFLFSFRLGKTTINKKSTLWREKKARASDRYYRSVLVLSLKADEYCVCWVGHRFVFVWVSCLFMKVDVIRCWICGSMGWNLLLCC